MSTGLEDAPYAFVVDDDAIILVHATEILEEAGFRTLSATTGDDALRQLEERGHDVVLLFTDVEMPGSINGFQLARISSGRWPDISILVASGQIKPGDGDLPDGAVFVSKPFSAEVVHDRLRQLLPDRRKPEPLKRTAKPG